MSELDDLALVLRPDQILTGAAVARVYDSDAYSVDRSKPTAVVLPETNEEVAAVVKVCVKNQIPITPRGAGTGLSGGAMPALGGVVVSLKRMNKILEVDSVNRRMKAQAGCVNLDLTKAVSHLGLHFAPDPSSQSVSTLGGNIAENSGGPHTLKYGVTAPHILGVTFVDAEGKIYEIGGTAPNCPWPDFTMLVVGSEGTLGIVTEAWIKLTPLPAAVKTALAAFPSVRAASEAVSGVIGAGILPAALEMMDRNILVALEQAFGLKTPPGTEALLLVECDGEESAVEREMTLVAEVCHENHAIEFTLAKDEAERKKLWTARKKGVGAMGRLAPSIVTHDGVIPRSKLPEMLDYVYAVAAEFEIGVANLFHAGDGNLHPCFYFDDRDPKQVEAVVSAGEKIIRRCIELGGSVTGEHGIGVEKTELLLLQFSEDDLKLQALVPLIFGANEVINPCKVIPNQKGCIEHKKRWRGVAW
ncbi:MAG: FAD-binding protein [Armatimonadetes bacterium]|nr:FAD-binding protein [Armatimonadota bacterium]